jgi:hypothetical protein
MFFMLTATIDGKEVQLAPDQIKFDEGYALITPDSVPTGYMKQSVAESLIAERANQAKASAIKDAHKDETVTNAVLSKFGIVLKDGKPEGVPTADLEAVKAKLHAEIKSQLDGEARPLRKENATLKKALVEGAIKEAAITAGMKPALVPMFAKTYAEQFGLDDNANVLLKDGDSFKLDPANGAHVNPMGYMDTLRKDASFQEFFTNRQQQGAPFGSNPTTPNGFKKSDMTDIDKKTQFIAQYGAEAFQNLINS